MEAELASTQIIGHHSQVNCVFLGTELSLLKTTKVAFFNQEKNFK